MMIFLTLLKKLFKANNREKFVNLLKFKSIHLLIKN